MNVSIMPKNIQNYDQIFEDDKLNIKQLVIDFAHLIEQDTYVKNEVSKVYSISAEFGIGKTFFCEKLYQVLQTDKIKVAKLNIWELDFYDNPLLPLLAKLNELYQCKGKSLPSKIIETIGSFTGKSLRSFCELEARGILGSETVDVIKEKFSSNSIYDDFQLHQDSLKELKKALIKWAKKNKTPIVIIIDELDRCRPDYAVKTLEVLKHFFNISGFVFILAVDEKQLENSVKNLYGAINFDGYKRKFISNTFSLPTPDRKAFADFLYAKSNIDKFIKKIQEEKRELVFKIDIYNVFCCSHSYSHWGNEDEKSKAMDFNKQQTSSDIIKCYFAAYSQCFGFSLRQMEQIFDRLVLFVKQIASSHELFSPDLAVLLICLHEHDLGVYRLLQKDSDYKSSSMIRKLFGSVTDGYAYSLYKEKLSEHFSVFDRAITPQIPTYETYSSKTQIHSALSSSHKQISDNIDRFFQPSSEDWISEQNAIDNGGVVKPEMKFDVVKFRENYFNRMDFIFHFD